MLDYGRSGFDLFRVVKIKGINFKTTATIAYKSFAPKKVNNNYLHPYTGIRTRNALRHILEVSLRHILEVSLQAISSILVQKIPHFDLLTQGS
jgi:hypothetical protein